jgi:hypothetical protein
MVDVQANLPGRTRVFALVIMNTHQGEPVCSRLRFGKAHGKRFRFRFDETD